MLRSFVALAVASAIVLSAEPAAATPLIATNGSSLVRFDSATLGTTVTVPVTGLQPAESLVGIDQRPSTGEIFGLGSTSRVYRIDPLTGAATQIGVPGAFTLNGTAFGTDFNPAVDRIRSVSNTEQNLRLNPNNGTLAATDGLLSPAGNVVAAAYADNVSGTASTTLYDIDSVAGTLVRQGSAGGSPTSPNTGQLTTVGSLGLGTNLNEAIGFDIAPDGVAYASIVTAGVSRLYRINLTTGAAVLAGAIGAGATPYRGLTVAAPRVYLTSTSAAAAEGGTATFSVTRSLPVSGPVSVDWSTAGGTATSGEDFTASTGTVTWGAGESGPRTIEVPVALDAAAEGDETFTLSLTAVTGDNAALGADRTATATIAANEAGPTLQFTEPTVAVAEAGTAVLSVTRSGPADRVISVGFATVAGTAGETDYTPTTGTLAWAAGDSSPKTIAVPIADDQDEEVEEQFTVVLGGAVGGAGLGTPSSATVVIAASDAKPPKLALGGAAKQRLRTVRRKGVAFSATVDRPCMLSVSLKRGKTRVGHRTRSLATGKTKAHVKVGKRHRKRLHAGTKLTVSATCKAAGLKSTKAKRVVRLKR